MKKRFGKKMILAASMAAAALIPATIYAADVKSTGNESLVKNNCYITGGGSFYTVYDGISSVPTTHSDGDVSAKIAIDIPFASGTSHANIYVNGSITAIPVDKGTSIDIDYPLGSFTSNSYTPNTSDFTIDVEYTDDTYNSLEGVPNGSVKISKVNTPVFPVTAVSGVEFSRDGEILGSGDLVARDTKITITAANTDASGNALESMTVAGSAFTNGSEFTITDGIPAIVVAYEEAETASVTFDATEFDVLVNGVAINSGDALDIGSELTINYKKTLADGKKATVMVNGTEITGNKYTINSAAAVALSTTLTDIEYSLAIPEGITVFKNGAAVASTATVKVGDILTFAATDSDNKEISAISVEGTTLTTPYTYTVANITDGTVNITGTVSAKTPAVVEQKITIPSNVSVKRGNDVLSNNAVVNAGEKLVVSVVVPTGETIKTFKINGVSITPVNNSAEYTVPSTGNVVITAETEAIPSKVLTFDSTKVSVKRGNDTLATGAAVNKGDVLTFTAVVAANEIADTYTINGTAISGNQYTVGDADITVAATVRTKTTSTITVPSNVAVKRNGVVVASGTALSEGDQITITATPATGYNLSSLTVNGVAFVNGSTYTVGKADTLKIVPTFAKINNTGFNITLRAEDENDKALKGVYITIKDANKNAVISEETDKNGKIEVNLDEGKYYAAIMGVPDGYIENDDLYTFTVDANGKTRGTTTFEIKKSSFTITRTDKITHRGIEGVSIIIKDEDNDIVFTGYTDSSGKVVVSGLEEGTYRIMEKYPANGYIADNSVDKIEIDEDGDVKGTLTRDLTKSTISFVVRDYTTGTGISNATLTIYNNLGVPVKEVKTNNSGEATIEGLAPGQYTFTQTGAPTGYTASTEKGMFSINDGGQVYGSTSLTNKKTSEAKKDSDTKTDTKKTSSSAKTDTKTDTKKTSTTTTATNTAPLGSKGNPTIKTGVEVEEKTNVAPVVVAVSGVVAVIASAVIVLKKKFSHKHN